jgi:hypothetical protein
MLPADVYSGIVEDWACFCDVVQVDDQHVAAAAARELNYWRRTVQTTIQRSNRMDPKKRRGEKQSPGEERVTLRLTEPLNEILRRAALYRGDISKTISEAVASVDLLHIKALDLDEAGVLTRATTIVIDSQLFARLKQVAKERGSSMNLLINSALAKKFGYSMDKTGKH